MELFKNFQISTCVNLVFRRTLKVILNWILVFLHISIQILRILAISHIIKNLIFHFTIVIFKEIRLDTLLFYDLRINQSLHCSIVKLLHQSRDCSGLFEIHGVETENLIEISMASCAFDGLFN